MPKVLLLAYHYPPLGGVAVMRVLRFSRYLSEYGWDPVVLCVDGGARHEPRDPKLLEEVPSSTIVERVSCFEPDNYSDKWDKPAEKIVRNLFKTFDRILFPDDRALWVKPVTKRALQLIRQHDIKVVWATAQPWSTLVAGRNIKRATGVPLVLDFRDDWTTSNADFRKLKRLAQEQALERSILEAADAVVSVTPHIVEQLQKRAPDSLKPSDIHYIPNGFDPSHFDSPPLTNANGPFLIVHAGGLYRLRPVTPLLKALESWFEKHPERKHQVRVKLAGSTTPEIEQEIAESPVSGCIELLGFVEHQTARALMAEASVNLLMIEQVQTAPWLFTGKVFEYIGAERPILMLGPNPSPLATLVRETGLGTVSSYGMPEETAKILETLYRGTSEHRPRANVENIQLYNAYYQTGKLAEIFRGLVSG